MNEFLDGLRAAAWHTSSARYNAARRLKRRELFGIISIATFSALTIVVAVVQKVFAIPAGSGLDNLLTAGSVTIGILLIIVSLVEWGSANGARAEALHRNAEALNAFQRKLALRQAQSKSADGVSAQEADGFRGEYESIKSECCYNHIPLDDTAFRATRRKDPEHCDAAGNAKLGPVRAWFIVMLWHLHSLWYFSLCWLLLFVAIVFAIRLYDGNA